MVAPVTSTPTASGLSEPSASFDGPLPMKISRPLPVNESPLITMVPARISKASPRSKARSWMMKETPWACGGRRRCVPSPTATVCFTAAPVVLNPMPEVGAADAADVDAAR